MILGSRPSIAELEGGFSLDGLCELVPAITPHVDYVRVTVGVRTTYVRDMATTEPPLLGAIDRLRPVVDRPLLVSQAFRRAESIGAALAAGADLVLLCSVDQDLETAVRLDLLDGFDHVVVAIGSDEVLPDLPGVDDALSSSWFIAQRSAPSAGAALVIVDDSFGWWPCASATRPASRPGGEASRW